MNFHVAEINRKNKEIDRLAQIIEEQKLEIEVSSIDINHWLNSIFVGSEEHKISNTSLEKRTIHFRKVEGKFGASHQGTSISKIDATGPAGMAGLKRGDQVISINGIDVDSLPQDEITKLSEECDDDVTLVVRYNPERLLDHVRF